MAEPIFAVDSLYDEYKHLLTGETQVHLAPFFTETEPRKTVFTDQGEECFEQGKTIRLAGMYKNSETREVLATKIMDCISSIDRACEVWGTVSPLGEIKLDSIKTYIMFAFVVVRESDYDRARIIAGDLSQEEGSPGLLHD